MDNAREEFIRALETIRSDERGEIRMTDESRYELIALLKNPGWIRTKDRLPKKDGKYLCVWQGQAIETGMFLNGHFRLYGEIKDKLVTHWMSLPEPPKEEKQDDSV